MYLSLSLYHSYSITHPLSSSSLSSSFSLHLFYSVSLHSCIYSLSPILCLPRCLAIYPSIHLSLTHSHCISCLLSFLHFLSIYLSHSFTNSCSLTYCLRKCLTWVMLYSKHLCNIFGMIDFCWLNRNSCIDSKYHIIVSVSLTSDGLFSSFLNSSHSQAAKQLVQQSCSYD